MLSTGGVISDLAGPCALIMFVGAIYGETDLPRPPHSEQVNCRFDYYITSLIYCS